MSRGPLRHKATRFPEPSAECVTILYVCGLLWWNPCLTTRQIDGFWSIRTSFCDQSRTFALMSRFFATSRESVLDPLVCECSVIQMGVVRASIEAGAGAGQMDQLAYQNQTVFEICDMTKHLNINDFGLKWSGSALRMSVRGEQRMSPVDSLRSRGECSLLGRLTQIHLCGLRGRCTTLCTLPLPTMRNQQRSGVLNDGEYRPIFSEAVTTVRQERV